MSRLLFTIPASNHCLAPLVWPCICLPLAAAPLIAQAPPTWSLAETPRYEIGGDGTELHRVRAAVMLPDGRVAIADRGNMRVVVVSAAGEVEHEIGREGDGPGEFRMLWDLGSIADTLLALDTGLRRVAVFEPDGELVRTVPLPSFDGQGIDVQAFVSGSRYLATSRVVHFGEPQGLYRDSVAVLLLDGTSGDVVANTGRRPLDYSYHFIQPTGGTTTYRTPFLGEMVIAAAAGRALIVPLDATRAEIIAGDGSGSRSVQLPVEQRPFDRDRIAAYRDSLLARAIPNSPAAQRLREVFGDDFPAPDNDPLFLSAHAVGDDVWIGAFPTLGATTRAWYVVDVAAARVIGGLEIPVDWQVLGGDESSVLILRRDDFDVEHVAVFAYRRSGDD